MGPTTITVMCRRVMEVIPFIFEVSFFLAAAIDHYPRAFDDNGKRLTTIFSCEPLWFHMRFVIWEQRKDM